MRRSVIFIGCIMAGLLSVATIRKNDDPILRTQTDPISYKQKQEETKDGVKGAPSPSFTYYNRNEFLTSSPMATSAEETKDAVNNGDDSGGWVSEEGEFEEQNAESQDNSDEDWWTEDDDENPGLDER